MLRYFRLALLLGLLAGLLGALAACGDTPTPTPVPTPTPSPIPPTATPVPTAPSGGTTGTAASAADLQLISDAITATMRVDSYHFSGTMQAPGFMTDTTVVGDYKSPDAAHLTVQGAGTTQEIINVGRTSYVKNPDGSWTSADLNAAAQSAGGAGALGGLGAMAGGLDPTQATNIFGLIGRFASGINSATVVGPDTVDGVAVTHFAVPVYLGNLMGTGGSTTPGETPLGTADLWIDPATKLVHRLDLHLDLTDLMRAFTAFGPTVGPNQPSPTPLPPVRIAVTLALSNFGQVGPITAPANATPAAIPNPPGGTPVP